MGIEIVSGCCFRKGMDANEYALKVTPAAESVWRLLLNQRGVDGQGKSGLKFSRSG